VAWMGYDEPRSLGGREFGATLALPIWLDYMQVALARKPELARPEPEGIVRDNDDWVLAEFAENPQLQGIDLDEGNMQAEPRQEEETGGDEPHHPRADSLTEPPALDSPVFVPVR